MATKEKLIESLLSEVKISDDKPLVKAIEKAKKDLEKLNFPTSKTEAWKYSRVSKIVNTSFNRHKSGILPANESYLIPELDASLLVIADGQFREDLSNVSKQNGIQILSLQDSLSEDGLKNYYGKGVDTTDEIFAALNTSVMSDGLFIDVSRNTAVEKVVHLVIISSGEDSVQQPRTLVKLSRGAELNMAITFISEGDTKTFTNHVGEFFVEENAKLNINIIQKVNEESFLINEIGGIQKDSSVVEFNTSTINGNWVRNNINVKVDGSGCETNLYGAYLPKAKEHIDNHTVIDHLKAHSESNELYKGVMHDKSVGVFNGKVFVRQDAQKTNAFQQNSNILLSEDAQMNSKPELEIYADDVKCSHGSTTGQFDLDALYYLQTRGISKDKAKNMLISAFVSEVVEKIDNTAIRNYINKEMGL